MIKNICRLEYKIEERLFHLLCDNDAPINQVKEACCQFIKYAGQIEDAVKSNQQEAEKLKEMIVVEEKPVEVTQ